jgi:glycosyltransferase involved in cell wall biosynthesis
MSSTPLVSIITPTYNHENFIADCINSVLEQTYTNWEMIIVDDGSTDNTLSAARSFAATDERIQVFTQENVGIFRLSETYNFALEQSKGKYIAILEGDDVWLPKKLALQIPGLEENPGAVLSWGRAYRSKADLQELFALHPTEDQLIEKVFTNNPIGTTTQELLFRNFIPALTILIRKSALEEIGGFIQNHGLPLVDLPTLQQLSLIGSFTYVHEPLGKWRNYPMQVTKMHAVQMAEGFYKLSLDFYGRNKARFDKLKISEADIHIYYRKLLVVSYSRSGRYKLIRKDFFGARKDYLKSIFSFGFNRFGWKLRSAVGLLFCLFHADIEFLAKKLGRVSYK